MKIHVQYDSLEEFLAHTVIPKDAEILQEVEEEDQEEIEIEEEDQEEEEENLPTVIRQCYRCTDSAETTQIKGRFLCPKCKGK